MPAYIAYLRVSTQKQGDSGLGLEAQESAIARYTTNGTVLATFREVESGKRSDRPELRKALDMAKRTGATLVIAKLDRLARNVHFISGLMEAGVDFVACDMPTANRLTLHIMAAMAEHEGRAISDRTRSALAAAKARGVTLGGYRGKGAPDQATRLKAAETLIKAADERAELVRPVLDELRANGITSLAALAAELNARQIATPRGGQWSAMAVKRVQERLAA
ncbi:MAG: recombinase family protein [Hyphomicrobium sp.]|nr:recombinase family protein [Hyphomicrobium sp.]